MLKLYALLFLFIFALSLPVKAFAVKVLNGNSKGSIEFIYNKNDIYKIYAKAGYETDLEFNSPVLAFIRGDSARWMATAAGNDLFIKPVQNNISTSATIITKSSTYQMLWLSNGLVYYHLVYWKNPQMLAMKTEELLKRRIKKKNDMFNIPASREIDLKNIDFNYIVSGSKSIRPVHVFSIKNFTYIEMKRHMQSEPLVFVVRKSGELSLVNYRVSGKYIIVERLFKQAALKLGSKISYIYHRKQENSREW